MGRAPEFFVSYTSTDRAWAEWIAWQLEAEGYTVVVQAWDFRPGSDFVQRMHQAVQETQRTIAVLSPAYLTSAFGGAEWRAVFAKDPTGERGLLLPVRVEEVEPPGLLTTRIYVDLVHKNAADARAALLAAIRDARGKPAEEPAFPGAQRRSTVGSGPAPRFPGELPPVWNVPFQPNPFFTGRDLVLAELQARLQAPEVTVRRVALTGLGGVGKTSLAVEYVYRRHVDYDLVWCVNGEQPSTLLADLAALATQLGLAADASEAQVATLRSWLEHHQRWLVVLDNVEAPETVAEWLPRSATGHVVITSRAGVGWEELATVLPMEVLALTDAADLLLGRAGENGPAAEGPAAALAATLGRLPLALEQAGAYVAATGTITLSDYAELFATRAPELLRRGQPLGYQHTVATTWSLALQELQDTEPAAVDLLTLASFLAPDDLPQPLLATHPDVLPEPLASAAPDPLALADTVATLRRYSLVRIVADGLYVHRLLQTVVRAGLGEEDQQAWAAAAVRLLRAAFPFESGQVKNWPECERLLPHVLAVADHGRRQNVENERCLSLLTGAAAYLWSRGQYRQALPLDEQALAGLRQLLGDDHPDTLQSMNDLANICQDLGDLQRAHQLFQQTLAARRRVLGEDHPATLASMNDLALNRRELGDLQDAHQLFEETLAARRRVLGQDHPATLWSMNSLAVTRRRLGDYHGARELHEQTLAARRRVLGEDHPDTLWSMNNLAETHRSIGDLQGAHQLHEQALTAYRRVFGDNHPYTLQSMNNLAETRQAIGDLQAARQLHEQTLAARQRVLGEDHPDTLASINNLAETRRALGNLRHARELHEQALASRQQVLGNDHPDTLTSMHNLALTRRDLGDLQGARELFEQALTARRRVLGDDHPATLWSMQSLAVVRRALGDLGGARELNEHTLAARRRILGDDHPDTLWSMHNLAVTRGALGDLQGARELHEQALAGYQRVLGDDHPATLSSMDNLAVTRRDLGDLEGARELGEQALAGSQRVLGEDHPDTLTSMNNLAVARWALGDLQPARDLLEQALAGRRRVLGEDHPDTLRSIKDLTQVQRDLGEL